MDPFEELRLQLQRVREEMRKPGRLPKMLQGMKLHSATVCPITGRLKVSYRADDYQDGDEAGDLSSDLVG